MDGRNEEQPRYKKIIKNSQDEMKEDLNKEQSG